MLSPEDQSALFCLARQAIGAHLDRQPPPPLPESPALRELGAVFITLHCGEALRGCIGHSVAHLPLAEAVRSLAVSSAFRDRRFPPVRREELPELDMEMSVLSPLSKADPARIEVGRHGLLIRIDDRSGLLLPQVASERGWDAETFLQHTCRKAGLEPDAWKDPRAEILWFTCEVYSDPAPARAGKQAEP